MDEIKLKPCPFCGSRGVLITHFMYHAVECENNDCPASYMIGATYKTDEEAIEAWNSRWDWRDINGTI